MRLMTLTTAAVASGVAAFGGPAFAQATDSLACTPKALEWEKIERSASIEQMRTFRADLPDICPVLKTRVAEAMTAAEVKSAAERKAESDRAIARLENEAAARAQAQKRELDAMRAELERQRKANEAELKRLEAERDQARVEAAAAAQKRAADEKAAREAEQKRQAELEAKREADRQAELKRQQQLAAQQQTAREAAAKKQREETERAARLAETDWVLGDWRMEVSAGGVDCTRSGTMTFTRTRDGGIEATSDLACKSGQRQVTRYRVDADAVSIRLRDARAVTSDFFFSSVSNSQLARLADTRMEGKTLGGAWTYKIWR